MKHKPLVVGNWKMHGSLAKLEDFVAAFKPLVAHSQGIDWTICPPAIYVSSLQSVLKDSQVACGAQNVAAQAEGAFTGEISASMLNDCGISWVLIGHSERRHLMGETDEIVAKKTAMALSEGLSPICCVGETQEQRDSQETEKVLRQQCEAIIRSLSSEQWPQLTLAYEPVWAIGTGQSAKPEQAGKAHDFLRNLLREYDESLADSVRILYGGSVKAANAKALFAEPSIDGFLVGGASLQGESFFEIGDACIKFC